MTAQNAIDESRAENRTITLYTESAEEFCALRDGLYVESDDSVEISGEGYSGAERRGYLDIWGRDRRVSLIPPPGETIVSMRGVSL